MMNQMSTKNEESSPPEGEEKIKLFVEELKKQDSVLIPLFEDVQTIAESTLKKEEGCYTITVILRYFPGHSKPYVTHIHTVENDGYISGHYFEKSEDAIWDYYRRCEEEKVMFGAVMPMEGEINES